MTVFDELEQANARYADADPALPGDPRPARALAVVTCMDARVEPLAALGLALGDAHVLRTAGARVTDDVLRSLTLSTHELGVRAVAVVGHRRCGVCDPDDAAPARLRERLGRASLVADLATFADVEQSVRDDCERLRAWPDWPDQISLAGYVLDVDDGRLQRVVAPETAPR